MSHSNFRNDAATEAGLVWTKTTGVLGLIGEYSCTTTRRIAIGEYFLTRKSLLGNVRVLLGIIGD